jgi:hypothetical protein
MTRKRAESPTDSDEYNEMLREGDGDETIMMNKA